MLRFLRLVSLAAPTLWFGLAAGAAQAQQVPMQVPKVVPVPPLHPVKPAKEPTDPPARDVSDPRDRLTFHLPPGWNLSRKDGEISTFHLDARTAPRDAQLRMVAALAFNPYPMSTFESALFYVSSTPHSTAAQCAAQTTTEPVEALSPATIDNLNFARGKDEHGKICTEARDVTYTALRGNACLRFDLSINSFCGGDVSGAEDLTGPQLQAIYDRLQTIVKSVHFTQIRESN
jgi:hypothetical protein